MTANSDMVAIDQVDDFLLVKNIGMVQNVNNVLYNFVAAVSYRAFGTR